MDLTVRHTVHFFFFWKPSHFTFHLMCIPTYFLEVRVGHTDGRTHGHNNLVRAEPVPGIVLRLFGTREPGTGIALRLFGTREGGLVSMIGEVPTRSTP